MPNTLHVYGSDHTGMPDVKAYDEHVARHETLAELWSWSAFPANALEQRWVWNGDGFTGCRSLADKQCPDSLAESAAYHYAEIESVFLDAAGEMADMARVCRP
jgi:hypothetical protein